MSDFLDLIPPHNAIELWMYPNFTPMDVRCVVWLMTYNFKERKRAELQAGMEPTISSRNHPGLHKPAFGTASESLASAMPPQANGSAPEESGVLMEQMTDETGFHGLGTGLSLGTPATATPDSEQEERNRSKKAAVATMLEGFVDRAAQMLLPEVANRARYYDVVRRAVKVALIGRAGVLALVLLWALRKWRRTRR